MTNEEALKVLSWLKKYVTTDETKAIEVAIEALKKSEKYKWHDLNKNPDDLPRHMIEVETVNHYYEYEHMFLDFSVEDENNLWFSTTPNEGSEQPLWYVRAWREIESFEGVE